MQDLRASPHLGKQKVQQIIDEWLGSEGKDVPACVATMSRVLRSDTVGLSGVARDFEKVRANSIVHCIWLLERDSQLPHSFNRHKYLLM